MLSIISTISTFMIEKIDNEQILDILDRIFFIISITFPPLFPTSLGFGIIYGIYRIKKSTILSIKPNKLNIAGKINLCAFDKTGTLTENDIQLLGARPVTIKESSKIKKLGFSKQFTQLSYLLKT